MLKTPQNNKNNNFHWIVNLAANTFQSENLTAYDISSVSAIYQIGEVHPIVEIAEPEEVRELMGNVKWIELLVSQIEESQNVQVVLVTPAKTGKRARLHVKLAKSRSRENR